MATRLDPYSGHPLPPSTHSSPLQSRQPGRVVSVLLVLAGIAGVALIDEVTGTEVRVYPLYFLPLAFAAWRLGRTGALAAAATATAAWAIANATAGRSYSAPWILGVNIVAQAAAFLTVALLIAWARTQLERERRLSRIDPLTSLFNSRAFDEMAVHATALCHRNKRPLVIAYLDLDNFKSVNDRFGHARGDDVLVEVARVLRGALRSSDVPARLGGDEFAVLLPETTEAQSKALLERLRRDLLDAELIASSGVSASIGAVCSDPAPASFASMLKAADALMYAVKGSGKNAVRVESLPVALPVSST